MGGQSDPLGIVQEIEVTFIPIVIGALSRVTKKLVIGLEDMEIRGRVETIQYWDRPDPAPLLENDTHKLLWHFDIQTDHPISARRPDLIVITKNYLTWELKKKLWNINVTTIPSVIGAFGTVTKGLLKGLENLEVGGQVETIQTTALLKTARILRGVLETWGNLVSLNLPWKTIS